MPEGYNPDAIATELGDCRQRGLDWLDHSSGSQVRVRAEGLQRLAEAYVAARDLVAAGRIAQIKVLLRDGIGELSRQGHEADAQLLQALFFGEAANGTIRPPGELLKLARSRTGDSTETRFRERRSTVMRSFAQFLITFATAGPGGYPPAGRSGQALAQAHRSVTGYVGDNETFIRLLAEAVNVTILGITNERLVPILQEALRRKRAVAGQQDAFWGSLRIVFLGQSLLHAVDDEREEFQDSGEALRQRRQESVWARRSLVCFLRRTLSTRWALYVYSYLPPLTGCLLEFDNRRNVTHLLVRRPRRPTADHLYVEMEDLRDQYFSAVFEDIVRDSVEDNMVVPVGVPTDTGTSFLCKEIRLHKNVLKDRSDATGWLPVVLVVTSRQRGGQVEAMLQLRTADNSARELNRLSHLCSHILHQDRVQQPGQPSAAPSFDLPGEIPLRAARRLVLEDTGDDQVALLRPVTTGSYLHPDKENLFFFVFALELPEGTHFPRRAEMHPFPLAELLAVRESQALRMAARLCRTSAAPLRSWAAAAEVVALNLALHDHADLGETVRGLAGARRAELTDTAGAIDRLVAGRSTPSWAFASREVPLTGFAGWQYREFFSVLLPLYAQMGVHGAAGLREAMLADNHKRAALARLAELYQDENLMALPPIEV